MIIFFLPFIDSSPFYVSVTEGKIWWTYACKGRHVGTPSRVNAGKAVPRGPKFYYLQNEGGDVYITTACISTVKRFMLLG